jgi:hypothetical protein
MSSRSVSLHADPVFVLGEETARNYFVVSWNGGSSFAVFSTVAVSFEVFGLS